MAKFMSNVKSIRFLLLHWYNVKINASMSGMNPFDVVDLIADYFIK